MICTIHTLLAMLVIKDLMSNCVGQLFWQGASAHLRHLQCSTVHTGNNNIMDNFIETQPIKVLQNDTQKNYNVTGYLKNKAFTLYLMLIFIAPLPRHYTCFKVSMMCTCNLLISPYNFIHSFLNLICIHGLSYLQSWTKMLIHLRKMLCISVLL